MTEPTSEDAKLPDGPWYHGSQRELDSLPEGATVTPDRHLAEILACGPDWLTVDEEGNVRHSGNRTGWLYVVDEPTSPGDLQVHPRPSLPAGREYITRRPLPIRRIARVQPNPEELLSPEEIRRLGDRLAGGDELT